MSKPINKQAALDALTRKPGYAGESYTDFTYQVQIRVDDETGQTTAFITSEGGEIGKPISAIYADNIVAEGIGRRIIAEVRREHYGEEPPDETDPRDDPALNPDDGGREAFARENDL